MQNGGSATKRDNYEILASQNTTGKKKKSNHFVKIEMAHLIRLLELLGVSAGKVHTALYSFYKHSLLSWDANDVRFDELLTGKNVELKC